MGEMPLLYGPDRELDLFTEIILADDRRAFYAHCRKRGSQFLVYDILSPDQILLRNEREVLLPKGKLDLVREPGIYGRTWADWPHRPTRRRRFSDAQDPWRQAYYESSLDLVSLAWLPSARREEVVGGQHYPSGVSCDPAWPRYGNGRDYAHLSRFERSRIRSAMRKAHRKDMGLSLLVRDLLADKYGVQPWMISRIAGNQDRRHR